MTRARRARVVTLLAGAALVGSLVSFSAADAAPLGQIKEFSAGITAGSGPAGIAAGPDGNLWFTEVVGDRVGRITPSGAVTEFSAGITAGSDPAGIAAGPDGNLWFTEDSDRVGRITPSGAVTEFSAGITAGSGPFGITAGPDGNLWFTEASDRIGRISAGTPAAVRLAGNDRIDTAVAVSRDAFGNGDASVVVVSRSDDFPDALAGGPLAAKGKGPLLLTATGALDPRAEAEIRRVLAPGKNVYVLGGEAALSPAVAATLTADGYNVIRYGGATRFDTAVQIADQGLGNPATLLLATGLNFPDALAGGPAAVKAGGAILLTADETLPPATAAYLQAHSTATRYALGGQAAAADPAATPVVGPTRYDTAVAVARTFFPAPAAAGVASGTVFADALPAGPHIATLDGPLLLTDGTSLAGPAQSYLQEHKATIGYAFVYGGVARIAEAVRLAVGQALT